jgi:ABC-type transport system substrate-binding protein
MSRRLLQAVGAVLVGCAVVAAGCRPGEPARSGGPDAAGGGAAPRAQVSEPAPKRGGTITMAILKDLTLMNPLVNTKSTDQSIRELMYEPLLELDDKGHIQPRLAESWEVSPDGKVYTFKLRRGVKFHDGREMTAEDAKFAVDYTMEPGNGAYGFNRFTLVERVDTPDLYTLRFTLRQPSAPFLSAMTTTQTFSVVPSGSLEPGVDKMGRFPPGTGPFQFVEWQPKQRMVFDRFADYWGDKAHVDRVVLRPIDDDSVRMTALRAGDVDIAERAPYEWVKEIKEGRLAGIRLAEATNAGFRRLSINVADPPMNNKKLRQALAHAVDKRELVEAGSFGFGETADQAYPRGHAWYMDGVPAATYDPDKARALLREAGYNGETIEIVAEPAQDVESVVVTLQAQLKKVGIDLKITVLEYTAQRARINRGDFAFFFGGSDHDADPFTTYLSWVACPVDLKRRTNNSSGYCDREIDALLQQAETELDQTKRRALIRQIVTRINDDVPYLPIVFVPRFFAVRDSVKGFTTDDDGRFQFVGGGLSHAWLDK